jgi:hypothetical protein
MVPVVGGEGPGTSVCPKGPSQLAASFVSTRRNGGQLQSPVL